MKEDSAVLVSDLVTWGDLWETFPEVWDEAKRVLTLPGKSFLRLYMEDLEDWEEDSQFWGSLSVFARDQTTGEFLAWATLNLDTGQVSIFVKPGHRRRGLGTLLGQRVIPLTQGTGWFVAAWDQRSEGFFRTLVARSSRNPTRESVEEDDRAHKGRRSGRGHG